MSMFYNRIAQNQNASSLHETNKWEYKNITIFIDKRYVED